jgi:hypothetical protein
MEDRELLEVGRVIRQPASFSSTLFDEDEGGAATDIKVPRIDSPDFVLEPYTVHMVDTEVKVTEVEDVGSKEKEEEVDEEIEEEDEEELEEEKTEELEMEEAEMTAVLEQVLAERTEQLAGLQQRLAAAEAAAAAQEQELARLAAEAGGRQERAQARIEELEESLANVRNELELVSINLGKFRFCFLQGYGVSVVGSRIILVGARDVVERCATPSPTLMSTNG